MIEVIDPSDREFPFTIASFKNWSGEDDLGLVVVGGFLEFFQPSKTSYPLAEQRSGIIVAFLPNTSLPPTRTKLRRQNLEPWGKLKAYYQIPTIIKDFVDGLEQQLLKPVIAVGTVSGGNPQEVKNLGRHDTWFVVPSSKSERFHGKDVSNEELDELVRYLLQEIPLDSNSNTAPFGSRIAKAIFTRISKSGHYLVPIERIQDSFLRIQKSGRKEPKPEILNTLIPRG